VPHLGITEQILFSPKQAIGEVLAEFAATIGVVRDGMSR